MGRISIELDENILKEAMELTSLKTKKEVIRFALEELIKRQRRKRILELEGKVQWEGLLEEMRKDRV